MTISHVLTLDSGQSITLSDAEMDELKHHFAPDIDSLPFRTTNPPAIYRAQEPVLPPTADGPQP